MGALLDASTAASFLSPDSFSLFNSFFFGEKERSEGENLFASQQLPLLFSAGLLVRLKGGWGVAGRAALEKEEKRRSKRKPLTAPLISFSPLISG